jgi:hypothetical protein
MFDFVVLLSVSVLCQEMIDGTRQPEQRIAKVVFYRHERR